jgi:hypothetical protein
MINQSRNDLPSKLPSNPTVPPTLYEGWDGEIDIRTRIYNSTNFQFRLPSVLSVGNIKGVSPEKIGTM